MKNYRHYFWIIGALTFSFAVIIVGILISSPNSLSVSANSPTTPSLSQHESVRKGRLCAQNGVSIENNIGGSGDDAVSSALSFDDKIYLFGNTNSIDFDFAGADGRGFVSVLTSDLTTEKTVFIGSGETVCKAVLGEKGFTVCFENNGNITLRQYTHSLELIRSTRADNISGLSFADLRYIDGKYYLISHQSISLNRRRILFQAFDDTLSLCYERIISSPFSLEYVDFFAIGNEFKLFMNCSSDLGSHLGVAKFNDSLSVSTTFVDTESDYRASSITPNQNGFVIAVSHTDGKVGLLSIDSNGNYLDFLHITDSQNAEIKFGGGIYYFFSWSGNSGQTFAISHDFKTVKTLPHAVGTTSFCDFIGLEYGALFCVSNAGKAVIIGSDNSFFATLTTCSNAKLIRLGNSFYCAYSSNEVYSSRHHFGKNDVLIVKLDI